MRATIHLALASLLVHVLCMPIQGFSLSPRLAAKIPHHQVGTNLASTADSSTTGSSTLSNIKIVQIDPSTYDTADDQVMQVASYRNSLTSPEMLIAKQQAKKDKKGIFGLTLYVASMAEARNRMTVDFVASLQIKQDVGFAAYLEDTTDDSKFSLQDFMDGRFLGSSGVVGCVDVQVRNSGMTEFNSDVGVVKRDKVFPGLPPHIHIKNMDVDEQMRRQGIGNKLMAAIEEWGKTSTDAELLTLEVRDTNDVAITVYEGCGFSKDEERKAKTRGLSIMFKKLE